MSLIGLRSTHRADALEATQTETGQVETLGQQRWNGRQGNEKEELMTHPHWWDTENN